MDPAGCARPGQEGLNLVNALRDATVPAVLAINRAGRISAFNREAETLLSLESDQMLHHSCEVLPGQLQSLVKEARARGPVRLDRSFPIQDKIRGQIWLRANVIVAGNGPENAAEDPGSMIVTLSDLTTAKKLEQGMRRLDQLASIGTLSASMAHEIKNALVAVRTFVDLLLKQNQEAELAEIVSRELRRIDAIVSQLLRCAGPAKPTFAPQRLHEVLDQGLELIQHQLEGKKIGLRRSFQAPHDLVRGDFYQLEQAFLNLFFNAIEAMGPNGELQVNTEFLPPVAGQTPGTHGAGAEGWLRVSVRDSGTGIPADNLGRLFESFFTTKPKGTGLGLPIARRIIEEHSGKISVESGVNKGTTFHVLLPFRSPAH